MISLAPWFRQFYLYQTVERTLPHSVYSSPLLTRKGLLMYTAETPDQPNQKCVTGGSFCNRNYNDCLQKKKKRLWYSKFEDYQHSKLVVSFRNIMIKHYLNLLVQDEQRCLSKYIKHYSKCLKNDH